VRIETPDFEGRASRHSKLKMTKKTADKMDKSRVSTVDRVEVSVCETYILHRFTLIFVGCHGIFVKTIIVLVV